MCWTRYASSHAPVSQLCSLQGTVMLARDCFLCRMLSTLMSEVVDLNDRGSLCNVSWELDQSMYIRFMFWWLSKSDIEDWMCGAFQDSLSKFYKQSF